MGAHEDGDLWKQFASMIRAKTAQAVSLTKVKGHAMEREGLRREETSEQKDGNDEAGDAAEKGVTDMQVHLRQSPASMIKDKPSMPNSWRGCSGT